MAALEIVPFSDEHLDDAAQLAGCDLYVIGVDGNGRRLVQAEEILPAADIAWSPRGDEILDTGFRGLYAVDVAHGIERTVATWPEADETATLLDFSTAGEFLALISSYSYGRDYYPNRATIRVVALYGGESNSILVPTKSGRGRLDGTSVWLP